MEKYLSYLFKIKELNGATTYRAIGACTSSLRTFRFLARRTRSWTRIQKNHYSNDATRNMYITTPIFYVNGAPHIGHLYSLVLADTVARFNTMLGCTVRLTTGTDEHGTKVQNAADAAKVPVDEYCTKTSQQFLNMCNDFHINYSDFIRTTEKRHEIAVHHFWDRLETNGHIYLGKYAGWYNEREEAFVSDLEVSEDNLNDTRAYTATGDKLEWTEEDTYKFRISAFKDDIMYWLKDEKVIQPSKYRSMLYSYLDDLPDLSISRPVKRVPWAISTPRDKSQTIYVWFDALINYLTSVGYPDESFKKFWPPTVQIIGKDILKFHGIYWPAFLMAAGLEPPKQLLCHGHWMVDNLKMSKSKGNIISPFEVPNDDTKDGFRYFLSKRAILFADSNYDTEIVIQTMNTELANTLGNLISRCFSKQVNSRSIIPDPVECISLLKCDITRKNIKDLEELGEKTEKFYRSYHIYNVASAVMEVLHTANNIVELYRPWDLTKTGDYESVKLAEAVISLALENIRIAALILQPIIPKLSSNILDFLQIPPENRTWNDTKPLHLNNSLNGERSVSKKLLLFRKIK